MTKILGWRALLFLGFVTLGVVPAQARNLTAEQWREDLAVLAEQLPAVHKEPFHTVRESDFDAAVAALHDRIPDLSAHEVVVRMASIVALINDGHTRLTGWLTAPEWGFRWYPVSLYAFEEGIFVRQAHPEHGALAGARLVSIDGHDADDVFEAVAQVVAADNRYGKLADTPRMMIVPEILHALGLVDDMEHPQFVFDKDGARQTVDLPPQSTPHPRLNYDFVPESLGWADARDTTRSAPLWLRHLDRVFWYEYLADERLLYVQQNQVLDSPRDAIANFYDEVFEFVEHNDVERFVLDLRLNGGGNNYRNRPVIVGLIAARKINQPGRLFTIIGRQTFSAAQNLVNEIEKYTETTFVGEPTAERVNFFGDTRAIELPNSGLVVRASWLWWQNHDPRDERTWTSPVIAAVPRFEDYRNNVDAALDAILHGKSFATDSLLSKLEAGALEDATAYTQRHRDDPVNAFRDIEDEINALGYRVLAQGQLERAIQIFEVNVAVHPESWNVYDSLGEALRARGDVEAALANYRRSLALRPDSPTGLRAVEELEQTAR